MNSRSAVMSGLLAFLVSCMAIYTSIEISHRILIPGEKFVSKDGIQSELFRFDSEYYYAIAKDGYSYNGDPTSSPNIVFAPLFPITISTIALMTSLDELSVGFAINKLFLLMALILIASLQKPLGPGAKWAAVLLAIGPGLYSFHAYYSESTMLLCLTLCLFAYFRANWALLAVASAMLGASRLAALPMSLMVAGFFLMRFWRLRRPQDLAWALICPLGAAGYLAFIWLKFGNPFSLLPEIQKSSWAFFHPDVSLFYILSGKNLFDFLSQVFSKGLAENFFDIKSLNLMWTLLSMISVIWSFRKYGANLMTMMFASYFAFIYITGGGSDFLISAHRFYGLMLPIFLMCSSPAVKLFEQDRKLAGLAVASPVVLFFIWFGCFHAAMFNYGAWFYF